MLKMKLSCLVMTIALAILSNSIHAAPPTPTNARPAWADDFSAVLTWDDVPEATAFWVYRYDATTSQWVIAGSDLAVPMFREVPPHQPPLQYAITALNAEGESNPAIVSIDATGFPMTMITAPPPGWNPGTLTETNAVISFYSSIVSGTDGLLEVGLSPTTLEYYEYHPEYAGGHNFSVTNLLPGTEYFYRLTISETSRLALSYVNSFVTYPMNQPPVAQDVTVQQIGEWETAIQLSGSDPDFGQTLILRTTTEPTKGSIRAIEQSGPGNWIVFYQPNLHARGTDTFQFVVSDGQLESSPATVTITDIFINEPPVVTDSQLTTPEDTAVAVLLQADDADGDALTYVVDYLSEGTLSGTAPDLIWTPPANFNGVAWLSFHVTDGAENAYATVQLGVSPVNDPPVAYGQTYTIQEDIWRTITLSATDIENDPITFQIVSMPSHGTLSGSGPTRLYRPNTNYFGTDSFRYRAFDGQAHSATVTVSIVIFSVDDEPVAINQSLTVAEDTSLAGVLTAYDPDGGSIGFSIASYPQHGTLTGSGTNFMYAPNTNYNGPDSFSFRVGGFLGASFGRIDINVTPVNDAPTAATLNYAGDEDLPMSVLLVGSDADGNPLSYSLVTQPEHGTITGVAPNLVYTPHANYHGADAFSYQVSDGSALSAPAGVNINIAPVNDAPVGSGGTVSATEDVEVICELVAIDIEDDELSFVVIRPPENGVLSGFDGNSITYRGNSHFNGIDSFDVQVNDGSVTGNVFTVTIEVAPVNDAPVANGTAHNTAYNTPVMFTLAGSDVEGSVLNFVVMTTPANGTLSGTAPNLVFTPAVGWSGTTSFSFKVNDGSAESTPATVMLTVAPAAAVPNAPSGLAGIAVSNSQINLSWNDNSSNEDGFRIERSNNNTWTQIGTVGPNVRTFSSTGLSSNKNYSYRVRAFNMLGNSPYSNTASAKTLR